MGANSVVFADDSCETQVKALQSTADAVTDSAVKKKANKLLATALSEATQEADEDECLDALKDAKEVLGVK
jgi:hypothetical protein